MEIKGLVWLWQTPWCCRLLIKQLYMVPWKRSESVCVCVCVLGPDTSWSNPVWQRLHLLLLVNERKGEERKNKARVKAQLFRQVKHTNTCAHMNTWDAPAHNANFYLRYDHILPFSFTNSLSTSSSSNYGTSSTVQPMTNIENMCVEKHIFVSWQNREKIQDIPTLIQIHLMLFYAFSSMPVK